MESLDFTRPPHSPIYDPALGLSLMKVRGQRLQAATMHSTK
jgi:hypothetical protein